MTKNIIRILKTSLATIALSLLIGATPVQAQPAETCGIDVKVTQPPEKTQFNVGVTLNGAQLDPNATYQINSDDGRVSMGTVVMAGRTSISNRTFVTDYAGAVADGNTVLRVINASCNVTTLGREACTICSRNVNYDPDAQVLTLAQVTENPSLLFPTVPEIGDAMLVRNTRDLCQQAGPLTDECLKCEEGEVWTALGCIPTSAEGLVRNLFRISLGIAGGVALLFILFGAFTISVSAGSPESVQKGKEMVTSAIIGLVFIIFSTIILQWIGVSILAIPGF